MPFLPDTPITIAYAVALALTAVVALWLDRRAFPVLAVMVANWLATRWITWADAPSYMAGVADISSAAVLLILWRFRAMAVLPVAGLYAFMVIAYLANDLGLIARETMWAFADVFGYAQLLVIVAGAASGGGHAVRLETVGAGSSRGRAVVRAVASRFSASPPA